MRANRAPPALLRTLALALVPLALTACDRELQGSGVLAEEARSVPPFSGVSVRSGIAATVRVGEAQAVRVSGDSNLVDEIHTRVRLDAALGVPVLEVELDEDYAAVHPPQVHVSVPALRLARAEAQTPLAASGLDEEDLAVEASDGSVVRLADGTAERLSVTLSGGRHGGAVLDAAGLTAEDAVVALTGGARAAVRATGAVTGTRAPGCTLDLSGGAACLVEDGAGNPACP